MPSALVEVEASHPEVSAQSPSSCLPSSHIATAIATASFSRILSILDAIQAVCYFSWLMMVIITFGYNRMTILEIDASSLQLTLKGLFSCIGDFQVV